MSRNLVIALAALSAVVLLGVFVVMPLVLDDDVDDDPVVVDDRQDEADPDETQPDEPAPDEPAPDPDDLDEEDVDPVDPVEETYEIGVARDPFQQLVEPAAEPAPAPDDPADPDDPDDPLEPVGPDDPPDDPPDEPDDRVVDGTTIRLNEVYRDDDDERRAQIEVNDSGFDVAEGDEFARHLRVLDLAESCATLLFGDGRFTLCEGETIRK